MDNAASGFDSETDIRSTHFDAIVLGAGISGLVSASVLLSQGYQTVLIVDEYNHVGGNHIDWSCNGYTFDVGSFIFQDDSPLLAHFPELLSLYEPVDLQWGRLNPQGRVTDYPISIRDDILATGPFGLFRIMASALYARLFQWKIRNAKEFASYWIGQFLLHRSGLESYMQRFYGIAADEIDVELARKRMQWISEHASLRNLLRRILAPKRPGPTNRQLVRPRAGFAELYVAATSALERRGAIVRTGVRLSEIRRIDGQMRVKVDSIEVRARRLISTIPIEQTQQICGMSDISQLQTITLISLFFSLSGKRGFNQPIIYNFSHEGLWKRVTVYSDFYGRVGDREYFTAEVVANTLDGSVSLAEADFRRHTAVNGLFEGDLRLEGSFTLKQAYPIYCRDNVERAAKAISELRALGIESFGRQGGFNYQPTARASTVEVEAALS